MILSLPWLIVGLSLRDFVKFYSYIYVAGLLAVITVVLSLFVFEFDIFETSLYNQNYAYILLLPAVVFWDRITTQVKLQDIFLLLLSLILMIFIGARGPIFSFVFFIFFKILLNFKLKNNNSIIKIIVVFVALIGMMFYFDMLLDLFESVAKFLNLSTRVLERLKERTFFADNSRIEIIEVSLKILIENPLFGTGIGAERIVIANKFGINSYDQIIGWYPHNIFIEILLHFGVVIGAILIIMLVFAQIKTLISCRDSIKKSVYSIFFIIGFFPLLFSGTYTESKLLFFFLGLIINYLGNNKVITHGRNKQYD